MPRQNPPPPKRHPEGGKKPLTIRLEPATVRLIDERRKAAGRSRAAECRFLIERGLKALSPRVVMAHPTGATPTADRVVEIMREQDVSRATAITLANLERSHGV